MVEKIVTTEEHEPRETVVIKERETNGSDRGSNGLLTAVVIIGVIILLLLLLGRSFGGSRGGTTNVNVPAPASKSP